MQQFLISIIVPCYNQAQYLDECLQSVLDQTYQNWECIIINDGSPDNTEEVALRWIEKDTRFIYLKKENGGVASARNAGIHKAKGEFVQFLDGDDLLEKLKFEYQIKFLKENPNVPIVFGASRYFFDGNNSDLYAIHPTGVIPSIDINYSDENQLDVLLLKNFSTICATLYRKSVFDKIEFKNTIYEDHLIHMELAFNGFKFHFVKENNGNCLIRLTSDSQMLKHFQERNDNYFHLEKQKIETAYQSKLTNNVFQNIPAPLKKNKSSFFVKVIRNITPPILLKLIGK